MRENTRLSVCRVFDGWYAENIGRGDGRPMCIRLMKQEVEDFKKMKMKEG